MYLLYSGSLVKIKANIIPKVVWYSEFLDSHHLLSLNMSLYFDGALLHSLDYHIVHYFTMLDYYIISFLAVISSSSLPATQQANAS